MAKTQTFPALCPADTICWKTSGWMGKVIRWFQTRKYNAPASTSHVEYASTKTKMIGAVGRIRELTVAAYAHNPCIIYRNQEWTVDQRLAIIDKGRSILGQRYAWVALVLNAIDAMFPPKWFPATKLFKVTAFKVCSHFVGWCPEKSIGSRPYGGMSWKFLQPHFIDDFCRNHPIEWKIVHNTMDPRLPHYQEMTKK